MVKEGLFISMLVKSQSYYLDHFVQQRNNFFSQLRFAWQFTYLWSFTNHLFFSLLHWHYITVLRLSQIPMACVVKHWEIHYEGGDNSDSHPSSGDAWRKGKENYHIQDPGCRNRGDSSSNRKWHWVLSEKVSFYKRGRG